MKLATDRFFEQSRAERGQVLVVEFGHHAQPIVQLGVDLTAKVLAAQTHTAAPQERERPVLGLMVFPDTLTFKRRLHE